MCTCMWTVCTRLYWGHTRVERVHASTEGRRAPSPGGRAGMTHSTRAAPDLTISARWLLKARVDRLQGRLSRRGKAQCQGAGHTGCGDRGPWVQPDTQHPLDFSVLRGLLTHRKVLRLQDCLCSLPASLELRYLEIKEMKDPEGRAWVLWPRARASWLQERGQLSHQTPPPHL